MGLFFKKKDKKAEETPKTEVVKAEAPKEKLEKKPTKAEPSNKKEEAKAAPAPKKAAAKSTIEKKGKVTIIKPASMTEDKSKPTSKAAPKKEAKPEKAAPKAEPKAAKPAPKTEAKTAEKPAAAKESFAGKFEIKKSKDGKFVFNLYAANSVIVATSQIYSSSAAAQNGIKSVIENAEKAPVEDQTLKKFEPKTYPKWEIYEDKGGQFRFRLCASNGSCVCHSQGYTSKASCKNGIESIIRTAKVAAVDKAYIKRD